MITTLPCLSRAATVGWIGLGAMGHPMALNLFTKTYLASLSAPSKDKRWETRFLICEQDDGRVDRFLGDLKERGGEGMVGLVERVKDGREMVKAASKVVTMLPSTPQVEAVYLDAQSGILAGLKEVPLDTPSFKPEVEPYSKSVVDKVITHFTPAEPESHHTLLIDQTTLDPTAAKRISETISISTEGRAVMLDAPVSGGTKAATEGLLTIMLGSPSKYATSLAMPLLLRMAREGGVIECGGSGTGVGVKVCNNLILAINQIALAEGLALGSSLGISPLLLHDVINTSSGQSWSSKVNTPLREVAGSPGSREYDGGFQSRLMLKDVGLALSAAHQHSLPTPMSWAAQSIYQSVCSEPGEEWATKDFSVVLEWLKRKQAEGVEKGWKDEESGA